MADGHIEELNEGAPVAARPAAAVILLRRGGKHRSGGLEVLLGRRTPHARFMADVWVFPGGAVDGEAIDDAAHRLTAMRELEEEAGVKLDDADELVPFARWITPEQVKVRYDTWFYLALAPPHSAPAPDGQEIVETAWFAPADALARHARGELLLVFPTIHKLQALSRFETAQEALTATRAANVEAILPKVDASGAEPRILLPGDYGY
jgi:8-oxo-dGTP pyrophosphatase MutT (NUDIX family)